MFVAVVVVCFWRSSWLAFLILTYYIKLMHQFLTPLSYLLWRLSYRSYRIFWKRLFAKNNFWVFLSVPHLLDNYAKIVDGRGRNFMCHRTLPSRLVSTLLFYCLDLKLGSDKQLYPIVFTITAEYFIQYFFHIAFQKPLTHIR